MISTTSNFHRARIYITNSHPDEIVDVLVLTPPPLQLLSILEALHTGPDGLCDIAAAAGGKEV
jgi:hypothetical protein